MNARQGRRSIYVSKDKDTAVRRLLDWKGEEDISKVVNSISARYLEVIFHSMPKTFTDNEWCFLFDVFKAPWTLEGPGVIGMETEVDHAIKFDRLDQKWDVDGQRICGRLRRSGYAEKLAIIEMTEAFWKTAGDEPYDEVIRSLQERLRPTGASGTSIRSQRMDRSLLPSISEASHLNDEGSDHWSRDTEHTDDGYSQESDEAAEFIAADNPAQSPHPSELRIDDFAKTPELELATGLTDRNDPLETPSREASSITPAPNPVLKEESPRLDLDIE